jgi:lysophospholipase L1-like esterase
MGWRSETLFQDQNSAPVTCRLAARLAATGSAVRAEFVSPVGHRGYRVLGAALARAVAPGILAQVKDSQRPLTFAGASEVQVPAGGRVLSDPVRLSVRPGDLITVTITAGPGDVPRKAVPSEPYSCAAGVAPLGSPASAFTRTQNQAYLRTVLVEGPAQRSIVALGDSLTEASRFAPIASYVRWTDDLVARGVDVVNAGVSGGELTQVGIYGTYTGLQRLSQALLEPGVTDVVLSLGTNDIAHVSLPTLLAAYRKAGSIARQHGVRLWVANVPPRADLHWNDAFEAQRKRLNALFREGFLREVGAGLIDVDAVVRDPVRPDVLDPVNDVGDHLHLSPAGEQKFASAVAAALGLPRR